MINIEELLNKIDVDKLIEDYGKEEPVCLDANGVPIKVGDVVVLVEGLGIKHTVTGIYAGGFITVDDGLARMSGSEFTNCKSDSWEQLKKDVEDGAEYYCYRVLKMDTSRTSSIEDSVNMANDIIRRCKRLAGVDDE